MECRPHPAAGWGDGLVRLEILGVPDSRETSFGEEAMLVSTGDPHRITALVIVVGAPTSALQQYDRYQAALVRARAVQPIHVLPAFVADDFVILARDERAVRRAAERAAAELRAPDLELHPQKTRVTTFDEGFQFVGWFFVRNELYELK